MFVRLLIFFLYLSLGPARTAGRRKSVAAERYDPETDMDETPLTVHPKTDSQRQRLKATLQNCFYFRHLDIEQMEQLIDAMFEKVVGGPEEVIIKEGDDGDYMYVVEKGVFAAFRLGEENGEFIETKPPKIYDNEGFFGELALMYNTPRAVCILSKTAGKLWAMDRQTFRRIVIKSTHLKLKQYEDLLQKVPLFQELTLYERNNVAYALQSKDYLDGEVIIKQADEADSMYFVEKGAVRCLVKQAVSFLRGFSLFQSSYYKRKYSFFNSTKRNRKKLVGCNREAILEVCILYYL